jgi:glycosyltransferase involved in cell wall biosynthesis
VGLPVGAAPDLLVDGCGVLVRPESEGVLAVRQARALVDLLKAPEADWRAMSERAHRRAHGYSWEDAAECLEAELLQATQSIAA